MIRLQFVRDVRDEPEVTGLAARGLTDEEIAAHGVVRPFTVKARISRAPAHATVNATVNATTKPGACDGAQLVLLARESGLMAGRAE
ncbi:hypothetical protein ABZT48_02290 [Streptomyces avermitilis]|uniref:hypothetical protein n=1 Tax=Streptomyces avermitilis TaxID=33903 RepID=UPI00339F0D31